MVRSRLFTFFAVPIAAALAFIGDIATAAVTFVRDVMSGFAAAPSIELSNGHPRSIFETRRVGLA